MESKEIKSFKIYDAAELYQRDSDVTSITTFSKNLDQALGNKGIQLSSITELLGLPGSGKTQLCLQLCASVQIPRELEGHEAEALYIDTNTDYTLSRFREILCATLATCRTIMGSENPVYEEYETLKKLHYVNAFGLVNFCAVMQTLSQYISEHPNIKLIVIDSIAFPFKEGISAEQRTGLLFRQMADLQRVAIEQQIAVVLTNEMSTRVGLSSGAIVGSLGDAWAHRCNKRVLLTRPDASSPLRQALLLKSNDSPNAVGHFQITREGIRDVYE